MADKQVWGAMSPARARTWPGACWIARQAHVPDGDGVDEGRLECPARPWPPREAPLPRASPGSLTDQLDPQIEAENVRGRGERVEADVVVVGVENPVQLAPTRAHRSSHGTLAHLPSFHGLLQLPGQNALDRIGSGLLEGSKRPQRSHPDMNEASTS